MAEPKGTHSAMEDIVVSVYCLAYNHEKYIRDALEGFVSQKTTFKYEVIVHDDASTDGTAAIVKEYAEKYPNIIRPILQTENQHSKGVKIVHRFIWPQMRGKYIAACEGDDYWTDPYKLQYQYEAMEKHPECSICSHYTRWIRIDNELTGGFFPNRKYKIQEGIVGKSVQIDVSLNNLFHLSSMFLRRSVYDEYRRNPPAFVKKMPVGDAAIELYFAKHGCMYFINREMSLYRKGTNGSWTQRVEENQQRVLEYQERRRAAIIECKNYYGGEYREMFDRTIACYNTWIILKRGGYKALRKSMRDRKIFCDVFATGGVKLLLKVYVCATSQTMEKVWDLLVRILKKEQE